LKRILGLAGVRQGSMQRPCYHPSFLRTRGRWRQTVHFHGHDYRLSAEDCEIVDYLNDLGWFLFTTTDEFHVPTLLRSRRDLLAICARPDIGALVALLAKGDALTSRWAIWLLGHSLNENAATPLRAYLRHPEPAFRKEAARALRRLEAWDDLWLMSNDRDERVRRLATRPSAPEYLEPVPAPVVLAAAERFARALGRLRDRAGNSAAVQAGSSMPFWSIVPLGEGKPPRAAWWLRRILLRIHLAIHGPSS